MVSRVLQSGHFSHVLTKNRFEDLVGEWDCVNQGDTPGQAFLQFVRSPDAITARGVSITVTPGASALLSVTWNLKQRLSNRDIRLEMIQEADGAIIGTHYFSMTVNLGGAVDRVTQPRDAYDDPMMEDEKSTRFAQWKSSLVAGSHVLVKAVGNTITASWQVTNTGGVGGWGDLIMEFINPPGGAFLGDAQSIPPGGTVTLTLFGVITTLVPGTTYASRLRVRAFEPATVGPGGVHDFTVTISAGGGAILSAAAGGPTIT